MIPEKNRGSENEILENKTSHDFLPLTFLSASLINYFTPQQETLLQLFLGPIPPSFTTKEGLCFFRNLQERIDKFILVHEIIPNNQLRQILWLKLGWSPLLDQPSTVTRKERSERIEKASLEISR